MLGKIPIATIEAILDALPGDLTFIDETDTVKYYNKAENSEEKIFPRKPENIGGKVLDCHKQEKSLPEVNRVLNELKSGKRDVIEGWTDPNGRKIYNSFPAVRDKTGKYLGMLIFTRDMTELLKMSTKPMF